MKTNASILAAAKQTTKSLAASIILAQIAASKAVR